MYSSEAVPDLEAILEPMLGLPYAQYDCWQVLRSVFKQGWALDLDTDPVQAMAHFQEIWFAGDSPAPGTLVQPWDIVAFRVRGFASGHVGIAVNTTQFAHTRPRGGLCLEPLLRWNTHILQMARLRQRC